MVQDGFCRLLAICSATRHGALDSDDEYVSGEVLVTGHYPADYGEADGPILVYKPRQESMHKWVVGSSLRTMLACSPILEMLYSRRSSVQDHPGARQKGLTLAMMHKWTPSKFQNSQRPTP